MGGDKDIQVFDPRRILIGTTPWLFLLEVALRGIFIYVVLLVAIRLMGKRVAGQLSLSELAIIVTLGAAIGVPMEVPQNGLLPAIVLLILAVAYQRGIGLWSFKRRSVELITQGDLVTLIADGVMNLEAMRQVGLSRERVFAALRGEAVVHLGEAQRVYIETSGSFSVYRRASPCPGLKVVPTDHPGVRTTTESLVCRSCGTLVPTARTGLAADPTRPEARARPCPACGQRDWEQAVLNDEG